MTEPVDPLLSEATRRAKANLATWPERERVLCDWDMLVASYLAALRSVAAAMPAEETPIGERVFVDEPGE